ncbi:hypothetical protein GKR65_18830 [Providencia alcalifaciens]|nr:hypothetical protein [Providencia alcalifaciens]
MTVGDFGLGKTSGVMLPQSGVVVSDYRINGTAYVYSSGQDSDTYQKGNHTLFNIFGHVTGNYGAQLAFPITGKNDFGFRIIHNNNVLDWCSIYHSGNTQADHNGNVKIPGYLERSDYPVGAPIPWPQATAPAGFLVCNGQSFNKITYPLLAKAYPTGVLPDLRGEFLRGLDAGRGVDSGRAVLSAQGDAFRAHNHSVIGEDSGSGTAYFGRGNGSRRAISKDAMNLEGGTETRPRNIAFLYIVRAA